MRVVVTVAECPLIHARSALLATGLVLVLITGCGTTRMSDTQRTATEQLVLSGAIDSAVSQIDFRILAGKKVYFDPQYLDGAVDRGYLISCFRQHLLANGCILLEDRAQATYIVEARTGGVGTDRHSLLIGVPQMNVPSVVPGQPTNIPEIPLARKSDQKAVCKIAVFAFNRETGLPIWQSGTVMAVSNARDVWLLGTGPFQNGSIRQGMEFAGQPLPLPTFGEGIDPDAPLPPVVPVTQAAVWSDPSSSNGAASVAQAKALSSPVVRGRLTTERPRTLMALIRAHLSAKQARSTPAVPAPPTPSPPPKLSPIPPNVGGRAETEPAHVNSSALGYTDN